VYTNGDLHSSVFQINIIAASIAPVIISSIGTFLTKSDIANIMLESKVIAMYETLKKSN